MGSEDDKNFKPTDEDKFAKLELQIQTLAYTFTEFMKESTHKTKHEKKGLKEDETESSSEEEEGEDEVINKNPYGGLKVEFKLEIYDYDGVMEAEKLDG
ncbi:hypothetical protein MKW98_019269, partial [Papaver atlanticum]